MVKIWKDDRTDWGCPMDEAAYLEKLRVDPDHVEMLLAYMRFLEEQGDKRADSLRLIRIRQQIHERLLEIDRQLANARLHGEIDDEWLDIVSPLRIRSPMVGRFYSRPNPDASPFVAVGDFIHPHTIIGIIESLKVFNEIPAGVSGVVGKVFVVDEQKVEFNQVLIRIFRPEFSW